MSRSTPVAGAVLDVLGDRLTDQLGEREWLELRRSSIGGSEVAAVLGASKWAGPWDVWAEKTGQDQDDPDEEVREEFERGRLAEPLVLADYAARQEIEVWSPGLALVRHPELDWLTGSPDGFALDPMLGPIGVECKSGITVDGWVEAEGLTELLPEDTGAGVMPDTYLLQVLTYLEVTRLPAWDLHLVAVPFGLWPAALRLTADGLDLIPRVLRRTIRVHRDPDAQAGLVRKIGAWRERHLVEGKAPDLDTSRRCRAHLRERYPFDPSKRVVDAPADLQELLDAWIALDRERKVAELAAKEAEAERRALEPALFEALGSTYGVRHAGGKLLHIRGRSPDRVDLKRLREEFPAAFGACKVSGSDFDYFRFYPPKH